LEKRDPPLPARAALSPDGKILVFSRRDKVITCIETATGQRTGELRGHEGPITCLAFSPDGRTLLSGSKDKSVIAWDLLACCCPVSPRQPDRWLENLEELWVKVGTDDVESAFRIVHVLAEKPDKALSFLKQKVPPPRDDRRVRQLITDLDSDSFPVRQNASAELAKRGYGAEGALRRTLREKPSLEVRRRIELLLSDLKEDVRATRRWNRTILLLEWKASPFARKVLGDLAKSSAHYTVTEDARKALSRLEVRSKMR
jgi:hypothetical protein